MNSGQTKARTERGDYLFAVKEDVNGAPWIYLEPRRSTVSPLKDAFIGLELRTGTTHDQAWEIAKTLNDNVEALSFTMFEEHRYF